MILRGICLLVLASSFACAGADGAGTRNAARVSKGPGVAGTPPRVRWFQAVPEEAFWVTRSEGLDRVIAGGARLELGPEGEVRHAAWETDDERDGDMVGSLAVAEHLGGGFLHWSRNEVFRSREFTGKLEPIALPLSESIGVRGARSGLSTVVVFTDSGPLSVTRGSARAIALRDPALFDFAALDASRALRLDLFGRAATTVDGGKTWNSASGSVGISVRSLSAGSEELSLETWQGRFTVAKDGRVVGPEPSRPSGDSGKTFQPLFKTTSSDIDDSWTWRGSSPLVAAVASGAVFPDGTAVGVAPGQLARVDLATGKTLEVHTDALPQGLPCQPLRADDGVLFLCVWEQYQGAGSYVLVSSHGEPPRVEHAFTDDGYFIADDEGALAFSGSCRSTPRAQDPDDPGRMSAYSTELRVMPTVCVRRGPGDWVERSVEVSDGASLIGWAARKDGGAVALALAQAPLPEPARGAQRVSEQGGVRLVRVVPELEGWTWTKAAWRGFVGMRSAQSPYIDRRFAAQADGSVDAWLSSGAGGSNAPILGSVTVSESGRVTVHDPPRDLRRMVATGSFGVALGEGGALFETIDHGRSWRAAGTSIVGPSSFIGSCSRLGCTLGSVVRIGWGSSATAVVANGPMPDETSRTRELPTLACKPSGPPVLVGGEAARDKVDAANRVSLTSGYGDPIEIVRDAVEPAAGSTPPVVPAPARGAPLAIGIGTPPPPAPDARKPKAAAAAVRTHTIVLRPPFAPEAGFQRLAAVDATFSSPRRATVTALLDRDRDRGVMFLLQGDTGELLVAGDHVTNLPLFEGRRPYFYGDSSWAGGLAIDGGRVLVLGDVRRRLSMEQHGKAPQSPPVLVGPERDPARRRSMSLARRDDGSIGILVFDGDAPETVGVGLLDGAGATIRAVELLAPWSAVGTADTAACASDRSGWRAVVAMNPAGWFVIDSSKLPGVQLGVQGLALVRWGRERVCVEAIDITVLDRRRVDGNSAASLVARFSNTERAQRAGAALRVRELRQPLECAFGRPREAR